MSRLPGDPAEVPAGGLPEPAPADGGLADVPLHDLGLLVSQRTAPDGAVIFTVKGETHRHRHLLRELGGRWDGIQRVWIFEGGDPRALIRSRLSPAAATGGLADAAGLRSCPVPPTGRTSGGTGNGCATASSPAPTRHCRTTSCWS